MNAFATKISIVRRQSVVNLSLRIAKCAWCVNKWTMVRFVTSVCFSHGKGMRKPKGISTEVTICKLIGFTFKSHAAQHKDIR